MAKRIGRFRIVEHRAGVKAPIWRKKISWNKSKANILKTWKRMLESQVNAKDLVDALKAAERPGAENLAKVKAVEMNIVKQWRALNKLKADLSKCIRSGQIVGEKVNDLNIKMHQITGPEGFMPMTRTLLNEFITLWAKQPETKATTAHLRALKEIRRNPNPKAGKRQRTGKKRKGNK